jgi:hypothetical protein
MALAEPSVVYPEAGLQKALVGVIEDVLSSAGRRFQVLERFGLDVAVFIANPPANAIRLFEVKAFGAQRMGGVGFGNQRGQGAQMDLLLCPNDSLSLFDTFVRWVYADATQLIGSARYALFTCAQAKAAAMGGVARGKQNNLRASALSGSLVTWRELCDDVQRFLLT